MKEVSIIGVDLAKQVFQIHGATAEGEVVFRKKRSRKQFLAFRTREGLLMPQVVILPEALCGDLAGATAAHAAVSSVLAGVLLIPHLPRS